MARIRDFGITIGRGKTGRLNKITDVPGVRVGHATIDTKDHKTGVTVILPAEDNVFVNKLTAASFIHNGFGKTAGLLQVDELGTLETPIALTNTLNVGKVHDAIVEYMIKECKKIDVEVSSLNPVVGETNDSHINSIQERAVEAEHVMYAIEHACEDFEEGDVGAGKGTICFGLKGGIGSASRIVTIGEKEYTLGVLVQSNFGATKNMNINGDPVGQRIEDMANAAELDRGSIMMIIATDLPVSDRQLKRIIKRAGVGLSRCGSYMGHGSGDVMIGFTTANRISYDKDIDITSLEIINESKIDGAFVAAAEATEEAILNSLAAAHSVTAFDGTVRQTLSEVFHSVM